MALDEDVKEIKSDINYLRLENTGAGGWIFRLMVQCCLGISTVGIMYTASRLGEIMNYQKQQLEIQQKQLAIIERMYSGD